MTAKCKKYTLTFDIDWAPDFAIRHCLDLLEEHEVSATFFATHKTPMNKEVQARGHNLGIHPNFLPNSSQGDGVLNIINECLSYSPNAWCMRTHSLMQSSPLLHEIFSNFPQLKLDVSLLMHRSEFAHKCLWDFNGVVFERLLYNWEDDAEFSRQRYSREQHLFFGELTVCDFHPIHVVLNSSNGSEYTEFKKTLNGRYMQDADKHTVSKIKNPEVGVESHLKALLNSDATHVRLDEI